MEEWKDIVEYVGVYQVSNLGRVRVLPHMSFGKHISGKIMKGGSFSNNYKFVCFRKNGKNFNKLIHRLVAQAFIPNPMNYSDVNHIDGDKTNNVIDNLEWCTRSYNLKHALSIGLMESQCKIRRKVDVKCDEKIITFETMLDCAKFFGFKKGWLHNRIRKHGCTFSYGEYEIKVHERECSGR